MAQVVERLVRDQEAGGSSPLTPTRRESLKDSRFLLPKNSRISCVIHEKSDMYAIMGIVFSEVVALSRADDIFIANCKQILTQGVSTENEKVRPKWEDGSPAYTLKCFGLVNRYNLCEEFPILTQRSINFRAALDEILWIWQRKSNNVNDLNSKIWNAWADETGSIGKAYGYQLGVKHKYKEGEVAQVDRVLFDLNNNPYSRRMMTNIYVHQDLHEMHLYPCAYSMSFNVTDNRLNAILNQRSQDMLVANGWNVSQYAALVHMMAHASGFEPGELVHVIADAHIYDKHIPIVQELIERPVFDAPKLVITAPERDFYSYSADNVQLDNYVHGPTIKGIPVAV